MIKQLSFKKDYLIVTGTLVLLLLGYQFAFKKTMEAWQLNHSLKQQLAQSADISSEPQYQEKKNNNLSRVIDLYRADTTEFRNNVIGVIAQIAGKEHVKLAEVPTRDPHFHSNTYIIQRLKFLGDYFSLIKVLNLLQITKKIGVVRSVIFKVEDVMSNNKKEKDLTMEIYLEIANS